MRLTMDNLQGSKVMNSDEQNRNLSAYGQGLGELASWHIILLSRQIVLLQKIEK